MCGDVAEWLRSGLQIRASRFDSGRRLQNPFRKVPQTSASPVILSLSAPDDFGDLQLIPQHPQNVGTSVSINRQR
jgi:hypothetical protein